MSRKDRLKAMLFYPPEVCLSIKC